MSFIDIYMLCIKESKKKAIYLTLFLLGGYSYINY